LFRILDGPPVIKKMQLSFETPVTKSIDARISTMDDYANREDYGASRGLRDLMGIQHFRPLRGSLINRSSGACDIMF
jgi:hypothetical protein